MLLRLVANKRCVLMPLARNLLKGVHRALSCRDAFFDFVLLGVFPCILTPAHAARNLTRLTKRNLRVGAKPNFLFLAR